MRPMPILAAAAAIPLLTGAAGAQVPVGEFYYFERGGATPEQDASSLTTVAREHFVSGAGGLTWSCVDGELKVTLTSSYLGRSMRADVRWAFDGGEPSEPSSWILRSTGMAVTAPADETAEFTARALAADEVVLEVKDYQFRRHRYTFGLAGLERGLAMLPCRP